MFGEMEGCFSETKELVKIREFFNEGGKHIYIYSGGGPFGKDSTKIAGIAKLEIIEINDTNTPGSFNTEENHRNNENILLRVIDVKGSIIDLKEENLGQTITLSATRLFRLSNKFFISDDFFDNYEPKINSTVKETGDDVDKILDENNENAN